VSTASSEVTRLFDRVQRGDESARHDLWTLLYGELRRLAAGQMIRERGAHTLEPTALVHEAWLRLAGDGSLSCENRAHFFGIAAEAMRRILVDHARKRGTLRRGGNLQRVELLDDFDAPGAGEGVSAEVEVVDEALRRLEKTGRHERKCQMVKLRFFAGLTNQQTAELLGMSVSSVKRDWEFAKAWLTREINRSEELPGSGDCHGPSN